MIHQKIASLVHSIITKTGITDFNFEFVPEKFNKNTIVIEKPIIGFQRLNLGNFKTNYQLNILIFNINQQDSSYDSFNKAHEWIHDSYSNDLYFNYYNDLGIKMSKRFQINNNIEISEIDKGVTQISISFSDNSAYSPETYKSARVIIDKILMKEE